MSETSDYPRQSPSPASEGESTNNESTNNCTNLVKSREQQQGSATRNRRATVPPHGNLLRVSLHRLPRATVHNKLLDNVHNDINSKLDKVVLQAELRTGEEEPARVKHENSESKLEGMKLEMAKLDSILHGNLLLDKSSHKISDMLLLDSLESRVKQDYGQERSSISSKEPALEAAEDLQVTCKWEGCGDRLEPQHLLDHLKVS